MTQAIILDQLTRFFKFCCEEQEEELTIAIKSLKRIKNNQTQIKLLTIRKNELAEYKALYTKELDYGHCFGFSICHAYMDIIGKLDWWQQTLSFIATDLNFAKNTLDNAVLTFQHDDLTQVTYTRRELYTRTLNYLAINQNKLPQNFQINNHTQYNFLKPNSHILYDPKAPEKIIKKISFFEAITDKEIVTIKKHVRMAGRFSSADFSNILSANLAQRAIMLISSHNHTMRLSYKNSAWYLYDPCNPHTTIASMQLRYKNTDNLYQMIVAILGSDISIEIATLDSSLEIDIKPLNRLLDTRAEHLICAENFEFILDEAPYIIENLLSNPLQTIACKLILTSALPYKLRNNSINIFEYILDEHNHMLSSIFALTMNTPLGLSLAESLFIAIKNSSNKCIEKIIDKSPQCLAHFLAAIKRFNKPTLKLKYFNLLLEYNDDLSGIESIAIKTDQLPTVLQLASQDKLLAKALLEFLMQKDSNNLTGLYNLINIIDDVMENIIVKFIAQACDKAPKSTLDTLLKPEIMAHSIMTKVILYRQKSSPTLALQQFFKPSEQYSPIKHKINNAAKFKPY